MFKKLNKMKIGARLKKSFRQIILIFGILSALVRNQCKIKVEYLQIIVMEHLMLSYKK